MDNERLIKRVSPVLEQFDLLDLSNKFVVMGLNAVALMALKKELEKTSFDCDVYFGQDAAPYFKVSWWQTMTGDGDSIIFRFNPLRVENSSSDLIAAYNRAMKIL